MRNQPANPLLVSGLNRSFCRLTARATLGGILALGVTTFADVSFAQTVDPTATPEATAAPVATATPVGLVITSEGISGDIDKGRRSPSVSVGTSYFPPTSNTAEHARILVDTSIVNEEYQKYPVRVDFYINRTFFTSQIRSTELPGPLGIEVTAAQAKVPFNYSIVATTLHPNREFTTVIHGAVFANTLNATLGTCSLTLTAVQATNNNSSEKSTYVASDVAISQTGNSSASLSFESSELSDGSSADTAQASASVAFAGGKATGTVTTTLDGRSQAVAVAGTGTIGADGVTAFDLSSADGFTKLSCK